MPTVPWICAAIALLAATTGAGASGPEGAGLQARAETVEWARFDARILTIATPRWRAELAPSERSGLKVGGVVGDVYFSAAPAGTVKGVSGGFRATSGLVVGAAPIGYGSSGGLVSVQRRTASAWVSAGALGEAAIDTVTVPYLGVGYSNAWPKSGWRVSADLGVLSYSPGGASGIGRVLGGSQSLDDLVREMRLAPVVQLGVSYSF